MKLDPTNSTSKELAEQVAEWLKMVGYKDVSIISRWDGMIYEITHAPVRGENDEFFWSIETTGKDGVSEYGRRVEIFLVDGVDEDDDHSVTITDMNDLNKTLDLWGFPHL